MLALFAVLLTRVGRRKKLGRFLVQGVQTRGMTVN